MVGDSGHSQQGVMLAVHPLPGLVKKTSTALGRVFFQCALMADIVIDNPLTPERSGCVQIHFHSRPSVPCIDISRGSGIKTDPARPGEISFNPRMGIAGSNNVLSREIVGFTTT